MIINKAFSTSIPRTLLSIMILCSFALGAVVFLQNLEIDGNAEILKAQDIAVQQKNNIFLINSECANEIDTKKDSLPEQQKKITSCMIYNQNIGDYISENHSLLDQDILGNPYTFKDVMAVVEVCTSPNISTMINSVKFQRGKSLSFTCSGNTYKDKRAITVISYK